MQKSGMQWKALVYKDVSDLRWNGQVIFNFCINLLFTITFLWAPNSDIPVSFILASIFVLVTMFMQGNIIVEEKEQRTTRRLIQVGFSLREIIYSKIFITFLATAFFLMIFFVIYGIHPLTSLKMFVLSFPLILMMIMIGVILGLKTRNTIEVTLYGSPIALLYLFIAGLLMNNERGEMSWLAFFPNYHLHYGIVQLQANETILPYLVVPYSWMVVCLLMFVLWFRKNT